MKHRTRMTLFTLLGIIATLLIATIVFVNLPHFGRLPRGERLERIRRSPHYRNGQFENLTPTQTLTSDLSVPRALWNFVFEQRERVSPDTPLVAEHPDLTRLDDKSTDFIIWYGHSSYLLSLGGTTVLVDPVFGAASPFPFMVRPYAGTDIFSPADLPGHIDYLVITHDHWDHLEYSTIRALRDRVSRVVLPLGVGEHFARWGYDESRLTELDWDESFEPAPGWRFDCLPTRHFSGRGLKRCQSLWASFALVSPTRTVFIGGDGGYDDRFERYGARYDFDLALLENGQYDRQWAHIHTLPDQLPLEARALHPREIITVHHSKYALAKHPYDEPLRTAESLRRALGDSVVTLLPMGRVVALRSFSAK